MEFPVVDLPPLETAYWLIKPEKLVRGTWEEPKEAADWLGERLSEYAARFDSEGGRDGGRLAMLVECAADRLSRGGDVSHGCYLERPTFLSLALVCCSPNRCLPALPCPVGGPEPVVAIGSLREGAESVDKDRDGEHFRLDRPTPRLPDGPCVVTRSSA